MNCISKDTIQAHCLTEEKASIHRARRDYCVAGLSPTHKQSEEY